MFVGNLHGGTLVYWRQLFDEGLRYPDGNLAEDAGFLRLAQRRGKRIRPMPNPGHFVYMRHGRNSWRYQPGQFLDAASWQRIGGPVTFSAGLLDQYRAAAFALGST